MHVVPLGLETRADARDDTLARVAWCAASALLLWLAVLQLAVVVTFALGRPVSPSLAPLVTAAALATAWWLGRRVELRGLPRLAPTLLAGLAIASGLAVAVLFFDLTWDGQWYHQTAVYGMAAGWNPVRDPMHAFGRTWDLWVLHYAKGPWYVALALFAATGSIEAAKAASVIAPVIAALVVSAAAIDVGLARRRAVLVGLVIALNPVTTCALVTHQVDGILVSLMACAVAAGIRFVYRPTWLASLVAVLATALSITTKFTGLVYLAFFFASGSAYCAWRQRERLVSFVTLVAVATLLGTVVLGYNPYVTNTLYRGHPFYPVQGTAEHPSLAQQGQDPIERYETPGNFVGRSRFVRLGYAVFGRPATAPYVTRDAELMWPFAARWRAFALYYFHDVRIGGFGPLFSGILLLAALLTAAGCARRAVPCEVVLLLCGTIIASLLVSTHTWWARYGPHLWWLPVISAAAAFRAERHLAPRRAAMLITCLLLVNSVVLSLVHMRWEWRSTRALRQQLLDLGSAGPVVVDLAYFDVPVAARLGTNGVVFEATSRFECPADRRLTLMSVCRGYPDAVRVCVADPAIAARLKVQPHWRYSAEP